MAGRLYYIIFLMLITLKSTDSLGQIHIGPKIGLQVLRPIYNKAVLYENISPGPMLGYNAGIAFDYDANKMFSFYSELYYTRKGKRLSGGIKDQFENKAIYNYIELPVLARMTFHENIKGRVFEWHLNGGGLISYWISGRGQIRSFEFDETNVTVLNYTIGYKPKPEEIFDEEFVIYMEEPNRVQVGLILGGGLLFHNPSKSKKNIFMVDLRYTLRHSWLGRDCEVDGGLDEYYEDFRTMEHIITLNLGYLFE